MRIGGAERQTKPPPSVAARERRAGPAADTVQQLHRTIGNRAVGRLLARSGREALLLRQCCGTAADSRRQAELNPPEPTWTHRAGQAFVRGGDDPGEIHWNDVNQGALGDCFFLASLMAVARIEPEWIRTMIVEQPDGSYEARLFSAATMYEEFSPGGLFLDQTFSPVGRYRTRISSDFPAQYAQSTERSASGRQELWPLILERAYARMRGGYRRIAGGSAGDALLAVTGMHSDWWRPPELSDDEVADRLQRAAGGRRPTVCHTPDCFAPGAACQTARALGVQPRHGYAVLAYDAARRRVGLGNPHGHHHLWGLTIGQFKSLFSLVFTTQSGLPRVRRGPPPRLPTMQGPRAQPARRTAP